MLGACGARLHVVCCHGQQLQPPLTRLTAAAQVKFYLVLLDTDKQLTCQLISMLLGCVRCGTDWRTGAAEQQEHA